MKGIKSAFFVLICLFSVSPVFASPGESPNLMELQKALEGISSISGNFIQNKKLDFLNDPLISKGQFHFSRPDYLKWEYISPAPSGLTIEDGRVNAWTGTSENRARQPEAMAEAARMAAGQVMIWMNMDSRAIEAAYDVSVIEDKPLVLKVVPKRDSAKKFLKRLEVTFSADRRTVRQVILYEAESRSTLTFDKVRLNRPRPAQ